jgi:hypothetical protein
MVLRATFRVAVAIVVCGGCGTVVGDDEVKVFVGQLDGEDSMSIAVAVQGDHVAAFLCTDDPTADDEYPGWFSGTTQSAGSLTLEHNGWTLAGDWNDEVAHGMLVELDGQQEAWTATVPDQPLVGLYTGVGYDCRTALIIVDPNPATAPLTRGACSRDGEIHQVTPLLPLQVDGEGRLPVEVVLDGATAVIEVEPVRLTPR